MARGIVIRKHVISKNGIRQLILLAAGSLFPLALAPLFWWPLGLLSLGVLYHYLTLDQQPSGAFRTVWWYALGQFGAGVSWVYVSMNEFGGTPAALAVLMVLLFAAGLALIPAFWFWIRKHLSDRFPGSLSWLTFPAFWLLAEWSRSWLLTGFPWLYAGDAHLESWLSGWAPVIGSLGISLICALTASLSVAFIQHRQPMMLLIWLAWPAGFFLQSAEWTSIQGKLTVSAVQGNIAQDVKWKPEMVNPTIQMYTDQTEALWQSDLIVWPETAVPMVIEYFQPYLDTLDDLAREQHSGLITGIVYRHSEDSPTPGAYHNSLVSVGTSQGIYHKQKLVPFGEFIPFEEQLRGLIPFFDLDMSGFTRGSAQQPLLTVQKDGQIYPIASYICYEIAYPVLVATMAQQSTLLITVSNDAWFGDSLGPKQHMALARMRALETGRYLLRSTNTGITALVNHQGQIIRQLPVAQRASLTAEAELRQGNTPFMLWHIWPSLILSILMILLASTWHRCRNSSHLGTPHHGSTTVSSE